MTSATMRWRSFVISLLALTIVPLAAAQAASSDAATLYKSKCVVCHGADGAGKSAMKNTDLRTSAVQKLTNEQLQEALASGKGKMPALPGLEGMGALPGAAPAVSPLSRRTPPKKRKGRGKRSGRR